MAYNPRISDRRDQIIMQSEAQIGRTIEGIGDSVAGSISAYGANQDKKLAAKDETDELRSMLGYLTDDPAVLEKFDSGSMGAKRGIFSQELALQSREERAAQEQAAMQQFYQKADYTQAMRDQRDAQEDAALRGEAAQMLANSGISNTAAKELAKRAPNGKAAMVLAENRLGKEEASWLYNAATSKGEVDLRQAPTAKAARAAAELMATKEGSGKPKPQLGRVVTPEGAIILDQNSGKQYRPTPPEEEEVSPGGMPAGGGDASRANPLFTDYYFD